MRAGPPGPIPDVDSRRFWQGCEEHRLLIQACKRCHFLRFPPRAVCPRCRSGDAMWKELSGRGTVWSFTVVHHAFRPYLREEVPYVVGIIQLEEGPRLVGRIEPDDREVAIGKRVRAGYRQRDGMTLPYFLVE